MPSMTSLRNLGLDHLDAVNLRVGGISEPREESIEQPLTVLVELNREGLIRQIGLSNISPQQLAEAQTMTEIVCVQEYLQCGAQERRCFHRRPGRARDCVCSIFPAGRLLSAAVVGA